MSDKAWSDITSRLHHVFVKHVKSRGRVMNIVWTFLILFFTLFTAVCAAEGEINTLWFKITLPVSLAFVLLIVPNMVFTYFTIRPLLADFEEWKNHLTIQFDKVGVEVIKVTTGEIVSGNARGLNKVFGMLWFGSSIWFRYDDCRVEIFWRSIKSGKRVRRYSLMVSTGSDPHVNQAKNGQIRGPATLSTKKIGTTLDETVEEDQVGQSNSTLDADTK